MPTLKQVLSEINTNKPGTTKTSRINFKEVPGSTLIGLGTSLQTTGGAIQNKVS